MNAPKKNIAGKDIRRTRMKWETLLAHIGWVNEVSTHKGIFKQKREESKGIGYEDACEKLFQGRMVTAKDLRSRSWAFGGGSKKDIVAGTIIE